MIPVVTTPSQDGGLVSLEGAGLRRTCSVGNAPGYWNCPSSRPANGTSGTAVRTFSLCDKSFPSLLITQLAGHPIHFSAYDFSIHQKIAQMF
ncbi:MAG: hypothetical protein MUO76_14045 [Anaerolineaceae bacterium]|nr:hypothetical protein [Anaerolineaceae bacterium]